MLARTRDSSPSLASGKALAQLGRDDTADHAIAEEFEPFVVRGAVAAVREGLLEERRVA
jgi:hypothetical protein